ncbi:MAG: 16S rRNA (guanine(966)-N(2))-methyltransferase RsmD [Chromatiales bacterium 21-64-14]|nr:MAG: 16S rRNA (guanine(966)-N(2))-methyltransferase RsmD [Chromatiales bacterium 21-64-14]HQU16210.1 16S rRNA (guanine(966)-N(2))-methyltransferase RsmD [Gammaproteobacteria bacterium]
MKPAARNRLRIIGGRWRGRPVPFPPVPGLRPTPDRVRETLFNWLQPVIAGARCLDLFAGSGALGLEAASRGAAEVVLVERETRVVEGLQDLVRRLDAPEVQVVRADALAWLANPVRAFDVVFLDPPFAESELLADCARRLEDGGWLAPGAYLYLEAGGRAGLPPLPAAWRLVRSKRAGRVGYHLAVRDA